MAVGLGAIFEKICKEIDLPELQRLRLLEPRVWKQVRSRIMEVLRNIILTAWEETGEDDLFSTCLVSVLDRVLPPLPVAGPAPRPEDPEPEPLQPPADNSGDDDDDDDDDDLNAAVDVNAADDGDRFLPPDGGGDLQGGEQDEGPGLPLPGGDHNQQLGQQLQIMEQEEEGSPHRDYDPVLPQVGDVHIDIPVCCQEAEEVGVGEGEPRIRRHNVRIGDILDVEGGVPNLDVIYPPLPDTTDRGVSTDTITRWRRRRRNTRSVGLQTRLGGRCTARQRLGWPY
jgi:hypothetical protein